MHEFRLSNRNNLVHFDNNVTLITSVFSNFPTNGVHGCHANSSANNSHALLVCSMCSDHKAVSSSNTVVVHSVGLASILCGTV